jgi:Rrf2 family transcriptional regulator, nitric oxide-sensitive transcriptional repressor
MTLNKASRIGLYAVTMMAERPDQLISAAMVAEAFDVSEDHVAKVLQQLVRVRVVTGVRGAGGGYRLAVDPRQLTMLDVVEALEGPLRPACYGCDLAAGGNRGAACQHPVSCAIRGVLEEIGEYALTTLQSVTIAVLAVKAGRPGDRAAG